MPASRSAALAAPAAKKPRREPKLKQDFVVLKPALDAWITALQHLKEKQEKQQWGPEEHEILQLKEGIHWNDLMQELSILHDLTRREKSSSG
jgi:hypothetical protein